MIKKHFNLFIIAIAAAICFSMIACPNGENGGDPRPTGPEPMSAKTAMQYFIDEGITVGINLGNTLDAFNWNTLVADEKEWMNGNTNQNTFNGLKDLEFNIIRIPASWMGHIGPAPDYIIDEAHLRRVAEVVNYARNAGLKAVINIHHDGLANSPVDEYGWLLIRKMLDNESERNQISDKFEKVWTQIAEYLKNYGDFLMFQGFNELHDGSWDHGLDNPQKYTIINDLNQRFTNAVRSTGGNNSSRYLLYYGYNTSYQISGISSAFILPTDTTTGRQIVGFHFYYPYDFSLDCTTHIWPNSSDNGSKEAIDNVFGLFRSKFINNGIPVIIGENGPFRYSDYHVNGSVNQYYNADNITTAKENRLAYIDYFYTKARENGIVPFFWETGDNWMAQYSGGPDSGLINRNNGQPKNAESRTVIERMVSAVNNATPPTPPVIGEGTAAVFTSWFPDSDTAGSSITHTTPSGRQRIQGTKTGAEGYANITATPDTTTLTLMRTMTSFTFMVSGDGKQYDVMIPTTESNVAYNHYRFAFTAPAAETKITVNVPANLTQADWGGAGVVAFIQNNVQSFQLQLTGSGTFDLTVWDIQLHE